MPRSMKINNKKNNPVKNDTEFKSRNAIGYEESKNLVLKQLYFFDR